MKEQKLVKQWLLQMVPTDKNGLRRAYIEFNNQGQ